jgi:transposase
MSPQVELKSNVITKVLQRKLSRKISQKILNISESTLKRYIKKFPIEGSKCFIHGNKGRPPANKTPPQERDRVMTKMKSDFYDFNPNHALEELKREDPSIKISIGTFRKWCKEDNLFKGKKKKQKIYKSRERVPSKGIMLQMDGSPHKWFGHQQSCLIACIDDADNEIPVAKFYKSETTVNYLELVKKLVEEKGACEVLYVDRAGIFGGNKRQEFAQFKSAVAKLGIQVIYAYSPQAKGRIERLFRTLQSRLIPLMRRRGIHTFEQANDYLENEYLPQIHNPKFSRKPKSDDCGYRKIPSEINLKEIFTMREKRVISGGHCIRIDGQRYLIETQFEGYLKGQELEIRTYPDLTWKIFFRETEVKLTPIEGYQRFLRLKYT